MKALRILRLGINFTWLAATVAVISLALMPHVLSTVGREMYVVKGASMQPALPLGCVILVQRADPSTIAAGDIITFHAPNGATVSHRVIGLVGGPSLAFQTKGDGSVAADPVIVPATSVVGVVESYVPQLGYVVTALGSQAGSVALVALLGGLLLWSLFLNELSATMSRSTHQGMAAADTVF